MQASVDSSCHTAMAEDALDANKMNINPGGKQPVMHDTIWARRPQQPTFAIGIPKGLRCVLEERGINRSTLTGPQMKKIRSNHDDFKNEKPKVLSFLCGRGHTALFLPKFHPELNPIERVYRTLYCTIICNCFHGMVSQKKSISECELHMNQIFFAK